MTCFKGSPIELNVVGEPREVNVLIDKIQVVQLNQLCSFNIETKDNGQGDIKVVVTSKLFFTR